MNSASMLIGKIMKQNIALELPSTHGKTVSVDIFVSVNGEETTHAWEFVWKSRRFTTGDGIHQRYCYEFSLSGKQNHNIKYGKSLCKIKIKDSGHGVHVEETMDLAAPDYNQFEFTKCMTFNGVCLKDHLMVSVILQCYPVDSAFERMLDSGNQTDVILQSYPQSKLKRILDSGNLTDVIIMTKSGNFPCHKVVLASESIYFEKMFSTDSKDKKETVVDWVGAYEADVVRDLLDYVYTGQTPPNFTSNCLELMKVAQMCLMDRLKTLCIQQLKETLSVENMGEMLKVAVKYEAEELQEAAVNFIVEHFDSKEHSPAPWEMEKPEFGENLAATIIKALVAKKIFL